MNGASNLGLCEERANPNATLAEQARYVAAGKYGSLEGFIQDASFTKWREASVRLGVPDTWSTRFPALRGASLTLAGRNLKTWTNYPGVDPEINEAGAGTQFTQGEFNTQPPVRYYTVRLDLSF